MLIFYWSDFLKLVWSFIFREKMVMRSHRLFLLMSEVTVSWPVAPRCVSMRTACWRRCSVADINLTRTEMVHLLAISRFFKFFALIASTYLEGKFLVSSILYFKCLPLNTNDFSSEFNLWKICRPFPAQTIVTFHKVTCIWYTLSTKISTWNLIVHKKLYVHIFRLLLYWQQRDIL